MKESICTAIGITGSFIAGLFGGFDASFLNGYVEDDIKKRYAVWVAQYGSSCTYKGQYGIWQKSCKGKIDGISGDVDMNYCYADYLAIIKKSGLNGLGVTEHEPPQDEKDTLEEILEHIKSIDEKLS